MFTQHVVLDGRQYRSDIMQACEDRLNDMSNYCARVFLVRFDVRYPLGYPAPHSNELCSELLRQFKEYYTNHGARTHYIAVREQASSENPHYHIAFFIDGSKFDNGYVMHQRLQDIWPRVIGVEAMGTIQWCKTFTGDYGLKIERPRLKSTGSQLQQEQMAFEMARQQARTWLLYLAKAATKGSAPFKVKEFFCSRL
jgi:hypothetical protein